MTNAIAKYVSSPLNSVELAKFLSDFFELTISQVTELQIKPSEPAEGQPAYIVYRQITITTVEDQTRIYGQLLHRTFKDGLMKHWGWDKKFTLLE